MGSYCQMFVWWWAIPRFYSTSWMSANSKEMSKIYTVWWESKQHQIFIWWEAKFILLWVKLNKFNWPGNNWDTDCLMWETTRPNIVKHLADGGGQTYTVWLKWNEIHWVRNKWDTGYLMWETIMPNIVKCLPDGGAIIYLAVSS